MDIVAHFTANGTPLVSPTDLPKVDVRRTDTGALVTSAATMVELGGGSYVHVFTTTPTLQYSARADGDPNTSGQVPIAERFVFGAFSGAVEARIETDIPQILVEISSLPVATDTVLAAAHGSGAWDGVTDVDSVASAVDSILSAAHGAGTWDAAGGTDVGSIAAEVESVLSAAHGAGTWVGTSTDISSIAVAVNSLLSGIHGAGSWLGTDASSILGAVVDSTGAPSVTVELALQRIHAYCVNNINRSGSDYAYRNAGDTLDLFNLRDNDPTSRISSIV